MSKIIKSPFTDGQRRHLKEWQESHIHCFMCANDKHKATPSSLKILSVVHGGLYCHGCHYFQNWAFDFMLDGSGLIEFKETLSKLKNK